MRGLNDGKHRFSCAHASPLVLTTSNEFGPKRVWNRIARSTPPGVLIFGHFWGRRYSRSWDARDFSEYEQLLQLDGNDSILDVGCGPLARAEVYFGQRGFKIVGIDVSATVASQAKAFIKKFKVHENVDLIAADAEFLPFKEQSFNKILSVALIVHLPTKKSAMKVLQQLHFCMKKNGLCLIVWLPNLYSVFGPLFKFVTKIGFIGKTEKMQLLNFKGLEEIRYIWSQARLRILRVFNNSILWIGFYLFPTITHKYIERIVAALNESNKRHSATSFFPYSFNIVAKRN